MSFYRKPKVHVGLNVVENREKAEFVRKKRGKKKVPGYTGIKKTYYCRQVLGVSNYLSGLNFTHVPISIFTFLASQVTLLENHQTDNPLHLTLAQSPPASAIIAETSTLTKV